MNFNGGAGLPWSRLERILSGHPVPAPVLLPARADIVSNSQDSAGYKLADGPAFAELTAVSSYSFLVGASDPEALVERACQLGLTALGICDHDGFYGSIVFAEAAAKAGLPTIFGARLSLDHGSLTVLVRTPEGYRLLSRVMAAAHMASDDRRPRYPSLESLAEQLAGQCYILVDYSWLSMLDTLIECFGIDSLVLHYESKLLPEDADHFAALDSAAAAVKTAESENLVQVAAAQGLKTRGTNGETTRRRPRLRAIISASPHAATRKETRLASAKAALAQRESLDTASWHTHPMGAQWLRDGRGMLRLAPGREQLLQETVDIAAECAFSWDIVAPRLPHFAVPDGETEMSWLRQLTFERARQRYQAYPEQVYQKAKNQIAHELRVIEKLGFPGYFLIVMDIVDFCVKQNILAQGRGSAANSVVCFSLGITNAEPISAQLLFERFLSADRDGPPDIDLDIESTRREEVIQYVYATYGRDRAAQVANVITYRRKGAVRDAARALGFPQGTADSWAQGKTEPPDNVVALSEQFLGQPRHLGIHSGGMVLCDRPVTDVVPTQWAAMEGRSVVQWDKDSCAGAGLVKFDLLGLGMLEALHHMIDLVQEQHGHTVNLWEIDLADHNVYDMLCRADAVGVFQVESRAQLNTLPRLKPRCFFDLVVEVALIRPGPIQGGSVHPYLRRRDGLEKITYDHPVLEKALAKTLGIPLFQEQLMHIAVDAAGFSGTEADDLRRAMGSKRSPERMAALQERFLRGCWETNQIEAEIAYKLWSKIIAFAAYGFPESHSQSFASLVFFSAWFKCYYPAEFCVGLLRAQPMGFYSPQSLIQDARRHGVQILPVSVLDSQVEASVTSGAIRLGLGSVKGLSTSTAEAIVTAQPALSRQSSVADLVRRTGASVREVEALARAGALEILGLDRRQAQWVAGVAATEQPGMLPGLSAIAAPALPGMSGFEMLVADLASTGVTPDTQPMELLRHALAGQQVLRAADLLRVTDGKRIRVAGMVTHRQRPNTASGSTFLGMEDETGLINVIVSPGLWKRQKRLARTAKALVVRGIVQNASGAATVVADRLEPLEISELLAVRSRDFQ